MLTNEQLLANVKSYQEKLESNITKKDLPEAEGIFDAIRSGDLPRIKELINKFGKDVFNLKTKLSSPNRFGYVGKGNALTLALGEKQLSPSDTFNIIKILLDSGFDPNYSLRKDGYSPLQTIITDTTGYDKVIKYFIKKGYNTNQKLDKSFIGMTRFMQGAGWNTNTQYLDILLKEGKANINAVTNQGNNALQDRIIDYVSVNRPKLLIKNIEYLLKNKAAVNNINKRGLNSLGTLLSEVRGFYADKNTINSEGTPFAKKMISLLVKAGAKKDKITKATTKLKFSDGQLVMDYINNL